MKTEFKNRSYRQSNKSPVAPAIALVLCLVAVHSPAQTYMVLHRFSGSDGANPAGKIVVSGTALYGAAANGGTSNRGTIFRVNTDGSNFAVLHNFALSDGAEPNGVELSVSGGTLYGTTRLGGATNRYYPYGAGTVFKVNSDGSDYAVMHSFGGGSGVSDGSFPQAGLVLSGETLYGGCYHDGGLIAYGTLFKINTDTTGYGHLWVFGSSAEGHPNAELVSSGSTLYGTAGTDGTVFRIGTDGQGYAVLKQFHLTEATNGLAPRGLVLSDAILYGMTKNGGISNLGTLFCLNTDGSGFTPLKSFTGSDGAHPDSLILLGTKLYGTAREGGVAGGLGVLFQMNTNGDGYRVLRQFRDDGNGANPTAIFVIGTTLYGATSSGGLGKGVLFSLSLSPPTIIAAPQSQTTEIGTTVNFQADAGAGDDQSLACQWFLDGDAITPMTADTSLTLTNIQLSQAGNYQVVLSNFFGSVTSSPAILNVIAPVERRPVPAINLNGDLGTTLHIEYTQTLGVLVDWLPLDTVELSNVGQFYFDVTKPLPPQRFYRAWQSETPVVLPSLQLPYFVPAITLTGSIGDTVRVDCINAIGPVDAWVTLDTITLTNTSQLYFDVSTPWNPGRLYRIVPVP